MAATLFLAALLAALAQSKEAAPAPYPPERPKAHVLYFMLAGELKAEPLRKALSELSTKEA